MQNFRPYDQTRLLQPQSVSSTGPDGKATTQTITTQSIAQGPVASQEAIKMLGTNGGGFLNANSAHPFENPTPLTNLMQMFSIFLIPAALTVTLGKIARAPKHGWAVFAAMAVLFFVASLLLITQKRNPTHFCTRSINTLQLHRLAATWRAKKYGSASPTRLSSPL